MKAGRGTGLGTSCCLCTGSSAALGSDLQSRRERASARARAGASGCFGVVARARRGCVEAVLVASVLLQVVKSVHQRRVAGGRSPRRRWRAPQVAAGGGCSGGPARRAEGLRCCWAGEPRPAACAGVSGECWFGLGSRRRADRGRPRESSRVNRRESRSAGCGRKTWRRGPGWAGEGATSPFALLRKKFFSFC
jgi:hypothetical protein